MPFYRGIPASEVIRALDELGFGGIIKTEREPKQLNLKLTFPDGKRRLADDTGTGTDEPGEDVNTA